MRLKISVLLLMAVQLVLSLGYAQTIRVSRTDALNIAKSNFIDRDVDYYLVPDSSSWVIFVDAEPRANWMHESYLFSVPKETTGTLDQIIPKIEELRIPPDGIQSLDVKMRYTPTPNSRPIVREIKASFPYVRKKTNFALILSGGVKKEVNYQRYWNDCSFIYQTLAKRYHVPRDHIKVIMANGTDTVPNMKSSTGEYIATPLDLDDDGLDDVNYAATKDNVFKAISTPSERCRFYCIGF